MSRRLASLEDERGQALVMMIVVVAAAAFLVQAIADGGSLLRDQRHTQAVADAAALAAVQELPDGDVAGRARQYTTLNGASRDPVVQRHPDNAGVTVTITEEAEGFFGVLFGEIEIDATARVGVPTSLDNDDLRPVLPERAYVAPLVVSADMCGAPPWSPPCSETLRLDHPNSARAFDLACASRCDDADERDVADWIQCSPCLGDTISVGRRLESVDGDEIRCEDDDDDCEIREALERIRGRTVIVHVVDEVDRGDDMRVAGFAALRVTDVEGNWRRAGNQWIDIDLRAYTAGDSRRVSPNSSNDNFGVRAFALTR